MKNGLTSLRSIPRSACKRITVSICLKCTFEFFSDEIGLDPIACCEQLKEHTPEEEDITGAATTRPHFFSRASKDTCPYCKAPDTWIAPFKVLRVNIHNNFVKKFEKAISDLEEDPDRYIYWESNSGPEGAFDDLIQTMGRSAGMKEIERRTFMVLSAIAWLSPSFKLDRIMNKPIRDIRLSNKTDSWSYMDGILSLSPKVYGDAFILEYLATRKYAEPGARTSSRQSLSEFMADLKHAGYHSARDLDKRNDHNAFNKALESIMTEGPKSVYYIVDREIYLRKLENTCRRMSDT